MNSRILSLLALAALACLLTGPSQAQTTFAAITGSVADSSGAVVPNVTIVATNLATNSVHTAKSNEAGNYTLVQLLEGRYSLKAQATGFQDFVVKELVLVARDNRRVDVRFDVGSVTTTVEVTGGAALIETETARLSNTKTSDVMNNLPMSGSRGVWGFLVTSPGVNASPTAAFTRFGGSRINQAGYSVDGTSFADGVDNSQRGPVGEYIESYQEVKVDMANNSAEFGGMGQMTFISKSGTNRLAGSLFDYYQTPGFRAIDYFATERQAGVNHWPGGSIGGPIVLPKLYNGRDRSFFFASYETSLGSQMTQNLNPGVPLAAWRKGDFTGMKTIIDPTTGAPFAGNQIPVSRLNPVSLKIQESFYPLPNYGDTSTFAPANYREAKSRPFDQNTYWTTRLDHRFSERSYLFGRFMQRSYENTAYVGNLPTIGQQTQTRPNYATSIAHTYTLSAAIVNELRWGYAFSTNNNHGPILGSDITRTLGLQGLAPGIPDDYYGMPRIRWSGISLQMISEPADQKKGYQVGNFELQDHLSYFRGRHNLKFGGYMMRAKYDVLSANNDLFGSMLFSAKFTGAGKSTQGHPYADFLLGISSSSARAFPAMEQGANRWAYDFYVTDDFKVNQRLTLNLGLRYEMHLPWRDRQNRLALFDLGSGKIAVPDGGLKQVSPIFPKGYVGITEASSLGLRGGSVIGMDWTNFAPRIGMAYRPWGQNTVVRAGWGMFYDVAPFVYGLSFAGSPPYTLKEPSYTNSLANPTIILPTVFPSTGTGGPDVVDLPRAVNPGLRTPYSMQYNATMEHSQWNTGFRLSYVGTTGRKSVYSYNANAPVADGRLYVDKPRRFANLPDIYYDTNGAFHQYNGLTFEVKRQTVKGLYIQSAWTWARDIHDMDYNWDYDTWLYTTEDPTNRRRERGVARDIPTHRWTTNSIYQMPFGKGQPLLANSSRLVNQLVGGWEISGMYTLQSGEFLTPMWSGEDPVGITYTDGDPAWVTMRPDILRNPNLPSGRRSIQSWFDGAAFADPKPGHFGTSAKGTVIGPGINTGNFGVYKTFFLRGETMKLRWEMVANNIFNHANWGTPNLDMTDPAVGSITSTGGNSAADMRGPRWFRMGLRLTW